LSGRGARKRASGPLEREVRRHLATSRHFTLIATSRDADDAEQIDDEVGAMSDAAPPSSTLSVEARAQILRQSERDDLFGDG
jgi:hypothetical protein